MIRVTDKTLSCLDQYQATGRQLGQLCELLVELGIDFIEISERTFRKIGALPQKGKYILKLDDSMKCPYFPEFGFYVRRANGRTDRPNVIHEIHINGINEIFFLKQCYSLPLVRITGLDDLLCHNVKMAFEQIEKNLSGKIELCPEDAYSCATASAVEWIQFGGRDVVASFSGIGGYAPTEQVCLALRILSRYKPTQDYSVMPRAAKLLEEITGIPIAKHRPVIGGEVFDVEAGIHADGVAKNPRIYEPYKPELVGAKRRLIIGKHSGKASVCLKMMQLGITAPSESVPKIVQSVHLASISKQRSLTDDEFVELVKDHNRKGGEGGEEKKKSGRYHIA